MQEEVLAFTPSPMRSDQPLYKRPQEVKSCYEAALKGDITEVRHQVEQLFRRHPDANPAWLSYSLAAAVEKHDLEMARFLLDKNVAHIGLPIELAVREHAKEILELFLQYGWGINQPMHRIEPPALSIALRTGDHDMVEWFLDHHADPNRRCAWDMTPTSQAMYTASLETIEYLFSRGADVRQGQLLHHAVLRAKPGALELVRRLVDCGAPVNKIKYEDDLTTYRERVPFGLGTPLHRAAEFGKTEIVMLLLEKGADPLKLDSKGKTARFWAVQRNHEEVAHILEDFEGRQNDIQSISM
ncbi:ankyrin, partial [Pseudovirgaria hyperparasitica]